MDSSGRRHVVFSGCECADWKDIAGFTWDEYLSTTRSQPVPSRAFKPVSYWCDCAAVNSVPFVLWYITVRGRWWGGYMV